ncbi:4-fold beta flower protein [Leptospira sp. WS92.C1]
MEEIDFYDKVGQPIAYSQDGVHIYTFPGALVAYLDRGCVYSYSGKCLGWFEDGWIRDTSGECVFYTQHTQSGPIQPEKIVSPMKAIKSVEPIKAERSVPPIKPIRSSTWSKISGMEFFKR